ncbi:hypothetical protein [Streptomyces sp. x-80]|uniref:hypothetical protein n=1 Tax=Streptomyces sp. x-80 TaxID=2789282 RepID=UPI00397F7AF8
MTVFPLLHLWPDTFGVVAYTTAGHFGDTAIVGYVPVPEVPDVHLMDVGARHSPQATDWVLCTGWSSRVVPKPGTLELPDTKWSLEVDASTEPAKPIYGHQKLHVGRMSLDIPNLMEQARDVLRSRGGELVGATT